MWYWCYSYSFLHLYFPCQHLASWAKQFGTKEKSAARRGLILPSWNNSSSDWRRFLSLCLGPLLLLPPPPPPSAGRVCLGAGGWTLGKGERRNIFTPLSVFPCSQALAAGFFLRFWSHEIMSCLGSLSSAQWTEREKRPGSECWFNGVPQNLVHLPNPSIIIDLSGSHTCFRPCVQVITHLLHGGLECPSFHLTPEPGEFYLIFTFESLSFINVFWCHEKT